MKGIYQKDGSILLKAGSDVLGLALGDTYTVLKAKIVKEEEGYRVVHDGASGFSAAFCGSNAMGNVIRPYKVLTNIDLDGEEVPRLSPNSIGMGLLDYASGVYVDKVIRTTKGTIHVYTGLRINRDSVLSGAPCECDTHIKVSDKGLSFMRPLFEDTADMKDLLIARGIL